MPHHFGWHGDEGCFYDIQPSEISASSAPVWDVHAGDMETATVNAFYPHLVDTEKAKSLPDVDLGDNFQQWMFGGQLKQFSPQGYLGSPSSYEGFDVTRYMEDNGRRIAEGIIARVKRRGEGELL